MNVTSKRRYIIIISIIIGSILLGAIIDFSWGSIEKKISPQKYSDYVRQYAYEYNVPESLIYAVIKVESNFDPNAYSSAGAMGLMQMMPSTFNEMTSDKYLGEGLDSDELFDPEVSIRYGTYYLKYLHGYFEGNWDNALAAYNGGMGNVKKWLSDSEYSDGNGNLTYIPFEETRDYVKKVQNAREIYKELYYKNGKEVTIYE